MTLDIVDEGRNNIVFVASCPNLRGRVTIKGDNNTVEIARTEHPGSLHISIQSDSTVEIGEGLGFGDILIYLEVPRCHLKLGSGFVVNGSTQITMHEPTRFTVGSDCLIASGASFQTSDVPGIFDLDTGERVNIGKDITIGDRVWIGAGAVILKGAQIGSGSIIAIRALVSGTIPPCSVAGGIPAKVIKSNVTWHSQLSDRISDDLNGLAQIWRA